LCDIAWAAGIYEGEGSVQGPILNRERGRTTIKVAVAQKERWLLDRMKALFGGTVWHKPYRDSIRGIWYLTGPRGRGFVMTVYPYLSPRRREQIRLALTGELLKTQFEEEVA
jgi:hypothetical protein